MTNTTCHPPAETLTLSICSARTNVPLPWYGQNWAELNHGKEIRSLEGYSFANWLRAHLRLLDMGLAVAGNDLAVELPFSGYGPLTEAASQFADHVVTKLGPHNQKFYWQANGWGPNGDWGAPRRKPKRHLTRSGRSRSVEANKRSSRPTLRGQDSTRSSTGTRRLTAKSTHRVSWGNTVTSWLKKSASLRNAAGKKDLRTRPAQTGQTLRERPNPATYYPADGDNEDWSRRVRQARVRFWWVVTRRSIQYQHCVTCGRKTSRRRPTSSTACSIHPTCYRKDDVLLRFKEPTAGGWMG